MGPRVLIVPSNRGACLTDFFRAWEGKGGWTDVVVVEDGPEKTFDLPPSYGHYSHKEIALDLGEEAWVISKKDSACLCYGFLAAWRMGAEYALTLSDDCFPVEGHVPIFDAHLAAMRGHRRWVSSVPSATRWPSDGPWFRVRGLPYENLGRLESVVNVGLWHGVPDLDARTQLERPVTDFVPPPGSRLVPAGQYVPASEMNLCVGRKAFPLMYFPLMGEGQPYRRFDDIWAGVIAKKICDHLGWPVSVGEPFIRHVRASDPHVNLVKEAPGVVANETFWQAVDGLPLAARDAVGCVRQIGHGLQALASPGAVDPAYLRRLGEALVVWAELCRRVT